MKLAEKAKCCGCGACAAVCAKSAVSMTADAEGFAYPEIDESKCVDCCKCVKACPAMTRDEPRMPKAVYAAYSLDEAERMESSSGGIFSLLARHVFSKCGVVFGAGFDRSDNRVVHKKAECIGELAELRGSKYVQSEMSGIYREVVEAVNSGRLTLFTGTPCQVAAIRRVAGHPRNLILVDLICHAVPSPLAWRKYLEQREAEAKQGRDSARAEGAIERISFRRKNCGWKRYSLSLLFANDREYLADVGTDPFLRGFLQELYNRPSCHDCGRRELRSGSDLTIADYWQVHEKFPEMDDGKGTSLVLANTARGVEIWESISGMCCSVL